MGGSTGSSRIAGYEFDEKVVAESKRTEVDYLFFIAVFQSLLYILKPQALVKLAICQQTSFRPYSAHPSPYREPKGTKW